MANVLDVLKVRKGASSREYPLDKDTILIGRGPNNDVVLNDQFVSRQHAKLFWQKGTMYLVDVGSTEGTLLNGKKLEKDVPYACGQGDTISISDFVLTYHPVQRKRPVFTGTGAGPVELSPTPGQLTAQPKEAVMLNSNWFRIAMAVLAVAGLAVLVWWLLPVMFPDVAALLSQPASSTPNPVIATTGAQQGLATYINTDYGYRINYPEGWGVNVEADMNTVVISELPDKKAELAIRRQTITTEDSVSGWLSFLKSSFPSSVILKNEKGQGVWDWYLSWDEPSVNSPDVTTHNEAYFKSSGGYSYMVWTVAPISQYSTYPFANLVNSFQLTAK
jgi:pSer/pThr/pTyr-binding forkhead associated (FHA) protein